MVQFHSCVWSTQTCHIGFHFYTYWFLRLYRYKQRNIVHRVVGLKPLVIHGNPSVLAGQMFNFHALIIVHELLCQYWQNLYWFWTVQAEKSQVFFNYFEHLQEFCSANDQNMLKLITWLIFQVVIYRGQGNVETVSKKSFFSTGTAKENTNSKSIYFFIFLWRVKAWKE